MKKQGRERVMNRLRPGVSLMMIVKIVLIVIQEKIMKMIWRITNMIYTKILLIFKKIFVIMYM